MNVGPEQLNLPHVGVEANITSSSSSSQRTHGNAFKLAAAAPRVFAKRWSLKKRRIGCNSNNNRDSSSNIKVSNKFFSKINICGCRNILWRFLFRFLRPRLNRKTCSWRNFTLGWVYHPYEENYVFQWWLDKKALILTRKSSAGLRPMSLSHHWVG